MKLYRKKRFWIPTILLLTVSVGLIWLNQVSYYTGSKSDHYDGERFFNPWDQQNKSFSDFLRWQRTREKASWPEQVAVNPSKPPQTVDDGTLRVTFVNHATTLIQTRGLNILTDPIWSERASPLSWLGPARVREPGVRLLDLPPINIIIVSHNHYDHMDKATLAKLAERDAPRILVPLGNDTILAGIDRVEAYDWQDTIPIGSDMTIVPQPVQHWSSRLGFDRNKALWAGYVITSPDGNLYFSGDTGYSNQFSKTARKFGPFRLALLPVGAYEPRWFMRYQHMNPAEAVQAHLDLEAEYSLGIHWGTFQLTDEGIDTPIHELESALSKLGVSATDFRTLENGQHLMIP